MPEVRSQHLYPGARLFVATHGVGDGGGDDVAVRTLGRLAQTRGFAWGDGAAQILHVRRKVIRANGLVRNEQLVGGLATD